MASTRPTASEMLALITGLSPDQEVPSDSGPRLRNDSATLEVPQKRKQSRSGTTDDTAERFYDMGHSLWLKSIAMSARVSKEDQSLSPKLEVTYDTVVDQLRNNSRTSAGNDDSSQFLPLGQLLDILKPSVVKSVLRNHKHFVDMPPDDFESMVSKVYVDGVPVTLKILAILMIMETPEVLPYFTLHDITDDMLPFRLRYQIAGLTTKTETLVLADREGKPMDAFQAALPKFWTYYKKECFVRDQMRLCAPFFRVREDCGIMDHYELPTTTILPFLNVPDPESRSGGFGEVTKVHIDPSHLSFSGGSQPIKYIAIKTIHHHNKTERYPKEFNALSRRIATEKHAYQNISRLLFSFKKGDRFSLALEWAEGNLEDLWHRKGFRPRNYMESCWFFEQCYGLATGLFGIHNLRKSFALRNEDGSPTRRALLDHLGRHGDIKPSNILYYPYDTKDSPHGLNSSAGPRLVLADLGCAQFSTPETKSHGRVSKVQGLTPAYKAPESETQRLFVPEYDIWALGCVFLEHAAVFLEANDNHNSGYDLLRSFSEERFNEDLKHNRNAPHLSTGNTFFRLCQLDPGIETNALCKAVPGDAVSKCIARLKCHENCSPAMEEFLNHIQTGMLVIKHKERLNAAQLKIHLAQIKKKCEEDQSYACPPGIRDVDDIGTFSESTRMDRDLSGISPNIVISIQDSSEHPYKPENNPHKRLKREQEVSEINLSENAVVEIPDAIRAVEVAIRLPGKALEERQSQ